MDRMAVYHRQGGKSVRPFLFDVAGNGLRHFARYLQETPRMTTCLLVDVVQEEYRQDVIPHVSASDRHAILTRKKQQYFRDTPYCHAEIQGRAAEGRRDDIVLYTALTAPDLVRPWIKLLMEHRVPLAGICSLSRLTGWLLDRLPGASQQRLVVSLQSISGLRETCFLNDKLKMSRLVDLPFGNAAIRAAHIRTETEVMLRYLNTMCTLDAGKPLAICYLADASIIQELRELTENTALIQHHFVDVAGLAQQLGLQEKIAAPFCDQLLVHLLLERKIPNYYATRDELRYYHRRNAGRVMHAASAGLMFTGLCWGGMNYIDVADYSRRITSLTGKAEYFSSINRIARSRLPVTGIAPADLKMLGAMAHDLERQKATPFDMLQLISKSMEQFPLIQVEQIIWSTTADPVSAGVEREVGKHTNIPVQAGTGDQRYQTATMDGYISPFHGDYRGALEMIDAFRTELENATQVRDVGVLSLPLDTGPAASLEGNSNAAPGVARFSLKIVMESPDET
jgi:hypothetical protein